MKTTTKFFVLITMLAFGFSLAGLWLFHPAHAAGPWYVAPGGDDGDDCLSPATPCETINGAIEKATAGDMVYVAEGTYTGMGDQVVLIDKDITLSGGWNLAFNSQDGMSTVDGEGARRCIKVTDFGLNVVIMQFTIQNGTNGIYSNGNLSLDESAIINNDSTSV